MKNAPARKSDKSAEREFNCTLKQYLKQAVYVFADWVIIIAPLAIVTGLVLCGGAK